MNLKAIAPGIAAVMIVTAIIGCDDKSTDPSVNRAPVLMSLRADRERVDAGAAVGVRCLAIDPDGDDLTYTWGVSEGSIVGTSHPDSALWLAPVESAPAIIAVTVSDGQDTVRGDLPVLVCGDVTVIDRAPEIEQARQDSVHVRFTWWAWEDGAQFVHVERKLASAPDSQYEPVDTVPHAQGEYIDRSLEAGAVYDFRFSILYCGGSSPGRVVRVDREWPRISASTPEDGARGMPVKEPIVLEFSEPIDTLRTVLEITEANRFFDLNANYDDDRRGVRILPPDAQRGYIIDQDYVCRASLVDTAGNVTHAEITFASYLQRIAYNKQVRDVVYDVDRRSVVLLTADSVDRFEFTTAKFVRSCPIDFVPTRMARNPADGYYYITSYSGRSIHVVDLEAGLEIETIDVLVANADRTHPARNPRTIAFAANGVGLVEVHADGLSGSGHSLEELRRVDGTLQIAYRPEFVPGKTSELEIAAADHSRCVMLHEYNSSRSNLYGYDPESDGIALTGVFDGFIHGDLIGAPARPLFVTENELRSCDSNPIGLFGTTSQFVAHKSFANDLELPRDRFFLSLGYWASSWYLNAMPVHGDDLQVVNRRVSSSTYTAAIACFNGIFLLVTPEGTLMYDVEDLQFLEQ